VNTYSGQNAELLNVTSHYTLFTVLARVNYCSCAAEGGFVPSIIILTVQAIRSREPNKMPVLEIMKRPS
jgi:hypothetical protein